MKNVSTDFVFVKFVTYKFVKCHIITTLVLDGICNSSYSVRIVMLDPMAYWSSSWNQKLKKGLHEKHVILH
jgi:hypothetical protein